MLSRGKIRTAAAADSLLYIGQFFIVSNIASTEPDTLIHSQLGMGTSINVDLQQVLSPVHIICGVQLATIVELWPKSFVPHLSLVILRVSLHNGWASTSTTCCFASRLQRHLKDAMTTDLSFKLGTLHLFLQSLFPGKEVLVALTCVCGNLLV